MSNQTLRQPKFLGVLGHFDQRLTSQHVTEEAKEEVLLSLWTSIEFLGPKNVGTVKHKLLSTLRTATSAVSGDLETVARAWETFVRTLDLASAAPVVCQITANLLRY